jgi:hypothetical protein
LITEAGAEAIAVPTAVREKNVSLEKTAFATKVKVPFTFNAVATEERELGGKIETQNSIRCIISENDKTTRESNEGLNEYFGRWIDD